MADEADIANDMIQKEMDARLKARSVTIHPSASECIECGDDIPEARQVALPGVQLCVYCQEMLEN